jgi:hypothetical protein
LDDLRVGLNVEVPALEHLGGGLAHDHQHDPLQLPGLQPLCIRDSNKQHQLGKLDTFPLPSSPIGGREGVMGDLKVGGDLTAGR